MMKLTKADLARRKKKYLSELLEEDGGWICQFWQPRVLTSDTLERLEPYFDLGMIKTGYSFSQNISTARIHKKYLTMIGIDLTTFKGVPDPILILINERDIRIVCHLSEYLQLLTEGVHCAYIVKTYATYAGLRERLLKQ